MIFVTGDTHIPLDISKLNSEQFPQQKELTKNDYVIICGDFGGRAGRDRFHSCDRIDHRPDYCSD